jgi:hypothetical protein
MTGDITTAIAPGIGASSYWEPTHLVPSAWREHAPFAFWLMSALEPHTVVELGTHNGFSFFVFAEAAERLRLDTRLYAIDSWEGDDQAGYYGEEVYQSVVRIAEERYPRSTTLVRAYFGDAAVRFEEGSIDLLHIDGRHGYDDVREDFETYRSKLSSRAVVVFHDTHEFQPTFGVHRFWSELSRTAPSFEFHHGHGLGVLAYGTDVSENVAGFLTAASAEPESMRAFYAERGADVSRRFDAHERLLALENENANLRNELLNYNRELEKTRATLAETSTRLEGVLDSTSWKFTAPLRSLTGALKRHR